MSISMNVRVSVRGGGIDDVSVLPIDHDFLRFYRLNADAFPPRGAHGGGRGGEP
jgi:hypothetical protein